ncbi:hypothetical protein G6O69_09170 [Pseudenhygromyxa sp. WMMC2535]|uniref:hypothetical protein n=1 Tax=Pseudenhygromyxa sp. WMMC2535 TaxID=2712867 RepID=UPI001555F808|nr:hypothetical protein [Pseudenhygromyxa sp. WMMC2535]NVB38001.1 hypothetical protein [Pseudenhygromyxa sp. WMMC2535]
MSLLANIDHLNIAAGIEAVAVDTGTRAYRGQESWHPVLDGALDLFKQTEEKSIRLVIGKHTVVVQRENTETVAVVLPTGHAIAKSLRRMIRRMARKDRGPLPKTQTQPQSEAAPAPAPTPSVVPSAPVVSPSVSPSLSPVSPVSPAAPAPTSAPPSPLGNVAKPESKPEPAKPEVESAPPSSPDRGGFTF